MQPCRTKRLILSAAVLAQISLYGQSDARSTILGRVSDPADAAVIGATVLAENSDTGVRYTAVSNASGNYTLPFLIPGPYSLTVESPGFKKSVRPRLQVRFEERITIDVTLEIGAVTETLQVTAETPLMDSSTVSMGQVLANKTVTETPLIAGNATVMASYSLGVLFLPTFPKDVRPFDTGSGSAVAGDGTLLGTAQFLLDGAANKSHSKQTRIPVCQGIPLLVQQPDTLESPSVANRASAFGLGFRWKHFPALTFAEIVSVFHLIASNSSHSWASAGRAEMMRMLLPRHV